MRNFALTSVILAFMAGPSLAMTDADCADMWKKADLNGDGQLNGAESQRYTAWMMNAGKPVANDGSLDSSVFMINCQADVFVTAAVDEGAPLSGANSFTETQAQNRAIAAGLLDISALAKDQNGIWRGTAMKDGTKINVAVDYKGNVVAQ